MNADYIDASASSLIIIRKDINILASRLRKKDLVFRDLQTPSLDYTCSEAGFIKTVSWLYSLYYESGNVSVDFLLEKVKSYGVDKECVGLKHKQVIHSLRTTLQHSLNQNDKLNQFTQQNSSQWFFDKCGKETPVTIADWDICLRSIIKEGIDFLSNFEACLLLIEMDQFYESIIEDWNNRCSRYHPIIDFERLVSIVSSDIGLDKVDPYKICRIYYDQWSKELENLRSDYDFAIEARKRIERDLIKKHIIPITSADIMHEFDVSPGPIVGKIWKQANDIYNTDPCTGEELIIRLKEHIKINKYDIITQ